MKAFRNILRLLSTLAAALYLVVFIDEAFPPYHPEMRESDFGIVMIFILFLWFAIGFFYVWTNEKMAGIFFTAWWIFLFVTAWLVWDYGNATVIIGFTIFILGILFMVYVRRRNALVSE